MARYKDYSYEQGQFIPVDFQNQIREGTFEFALNHIIDNKLDLFEFDSVYKNDNTGAPAYDPKIMLKIIFYAYSMGITSSRRIERECENNIIFMALSAYTKPHFTTIAYFISSMGDKATKLFTDIVLLCDQLGLIGKNMFAMDGCKISSNAAKEWSGKIEDYERRKNKMEEEVERLIKKHGELDALKEDYKEQIKKEKKAIDNYKNKINKFSEFIKENNDRISSSGNNVQSNITDPESAKLTSGREVKQGYNAIATVDDKHQIVVDAEVLGSINEREAVEPRVKIIKETLGKNIFKETKFTADTGFSSEAVLESLDKEGVDAYIPDIGFRKRDPKLKGREKHNRQIDKKKKYITKYFGLQDFKYDDKNDRLICPAGEWLYRSGDTVNIKKYIAIRYKGRDSKCQNCKLRAQCLRNKKTKIRQVYKILDKELTSDKKLFIQRMKDKIDSVKGRFIYSKRMGCVEPVFAHICHTMKLHNFTMRGKLKVNSQWKIFTTLHNIKKIFKFSPLFA